MEEVILPVIDPALLGLIHQKAIQQQAVSAMVETKSILEEGEDQPDTTLSLVSPTVSNPSASDLVEVREAGPSTLPVELIPTPGF